MYVCARAEGQPETYVVQSSLILLLAGEATESPGSFLILRGTGCPRGSRCSARKRLLCGLRFARHGGTGLHAPGEAMWFLGHAMGAPGEFWGWGRSSQVHFPRVCAVSHMRHAAARIAIQIRDGGLRRGTCQDVKTKGREAEGYVAPS